MSAPMVKRVADPRTAVVLDRLQEAFIQAATAKGVDLDQVLAGTAQLAGHLIVAGSYRADIGREIVLKNLEYGIEAARTTRKAVVQ